jgi:hypothetical protein
MAATLLGDELAVRVRAYVAAASTERDEDSERRAKRREAKLRKQQQQRAKLRGSAPSQMRRLRVLCLHGYAQEAQGLRSKSGSLRRAAKGCADFVFVESPLHAAECPHSKAHGIGARPAWWNFTDGPHPRYHGWEESLAFIADVCVEKGPFDGVLGFSQGAAMAAMLCAQPGNAPRAAMLADAASFQFAAVFSGFVPRDARAAARLERGASGATSVFSCYGEGDAIIEPARSEALADILKRGGAEDVRVVHDGGHLVPSSPAVRRAFAAFLRAQQQRICGGA